MKQLSILGIFSILLSPLANADYKSHFLIGVELGQESRSGHLNSNYATGAFFGGFTPLGSANPKISDSGTIYGVLAGYQVWCNHLFASAEGHIDFGRYEDVHFYTIPTTFFPAFSLNGEATYSQDTRYGGTVRVGLDVPPYFRPYVKGGIEYSHHELSLTNNIVFGGVPTPAFDHISSGHGLWTWLIGVGMEIPFFSDKTSLRLEYNYKPGRHLSFQETQDLLISDHDIRAHTHQGKLAWVWNFI